MWQARSCSVCHLLNVVQSAWDQRIYVAGFDPQELHSLAVFFSALQGRKTKTERLYSGEPGRVRNAEVTHIRKARPRAVMACPYALRGRAISLY